MAGLVFVKQNNGYYLSLISVYMMIFYRDKRFMVVKNHYLYFYEFSSQSAKNARTRLDGWRWAR